MLSWVEDRFDFTKKRSVLAGFFYSFLFFFLMGLVYAVFALVFLGWFKPTMINLIVLGVVGILAEFFMGYICYAFVDRKNLQPRKKYFILITAALLGDLLLTILSQNGSNFFVWVSMWVLMTRAPVDRVQEQSFHKKSDILKAIYGNEKVDEVKQIFSMSPDLLQGDAQGNKPIHHYAKQGNIEMLRVVIELGNKIDSLNKAGETPLHVAVRAQKVQAIDFLLEQEGVNIESKTSKNMTPLQVAAIEGYSDMAQFLLDKGAKVDAHSAAMLGRIEDLKNLGQENPTHLLTIDRALGCAPLHSAIFTQQPESVEYLVGQGADVKLADEDGHDAFWWQEQVPHQKIKEILDSAKAVNQSPKDDLVASKDVQDDLELTENPELKMAANDNPSEVFEITDETEIEELVIEEEVVVQDSLVVEDLSQVDELELVSDIVEKDLQTVSDAQLKENEPVEEAPADEASGYKPF